MGNKKQLNGVMSLWGAFTYKS